MTFMTKMWFDFNDVPFITVCKQTVQVKSLKRIIHIPDEERGTNKAQNRLDSSEVDISRLKHFFLYSFYIFNRQHWQTIMIASE